MRPARIEGDARSFSCRTFALAASLTCTASNSERSRMASWSPAYATTDLASRESLATGANSLVIQIFRQAADRPQLQIAPENQPHGFGFLGDDDEFLVDAGIAQGN